MRVPRIRTRCVRRSFANATLLNPSEKVVLRRRQMFVRRDRLVVCFGFVVREFRC